MIDLAVETRRLRAAPATWSNSDRAHVVPLLFTSSLLQPTTWRRSKRCVLRIPIFSIYARFAHTWPNCLQRLAHLKQEADAAVERAEAAEAKIKLLEQELMARDQDITSLSHRLAVAEDEVAKREGELEKSKVRASESDNLHQTGDSLRRKIQLLEEELDQAEKNVKETVEKCVTDWSVTDAEPKLII